MSRIEAIRGEHQIVPGDASTTGSPVEGTNSRALDQWRGLALICVLVSHGFYFTNRVHGFGRVGVNLFFFISGILVYRSLAKKPELTSAARSFSFWKSRLRRLYPAMLGYAIAMTPVAYLMQTRERSLPLPDFKDYVASLPLALACVMNYARGMPMALGHLWSISCEMQFYLVAPLVFMAGGGNARRKNLIWIGLLGLLSLLGIAQPLVGDSVKYHFEFAVWPMMLGFFCEYQKPLFGTLPQRPIKWIVRFALALFVISSVAMLATGRFKNIVIALGAVMFVPCFGSYVTGRNLKGRPGNFLAWIGARTYSIYLWQQPLTICRYLPNFLHPVGAVAAIGLGAVWFNLLERPFLSPKRQKSSSGA